MLEKSLLVASRSFVDLLLTTSREQQKAILASVTDGQVKVLCEIAFNLLHMKVETRLEKEVKREISLLKSLQKKTTSIKRKKFLIRKNTNKILRILEQIKTNLLQVIE